MSCGRVSGFEYRKVGPVNHGESCSAFIDFGRVPMSAGFLSVGMYCHVVGSEILSISRTRVAQNFFKGCEGSWIHVNTTLLSVKN